MPVPGAGSYSAQGPKIRTGSEMQPREGACRLPLTSEPSAWEAELGAAPPVTKPLWGGCTEATPSIGATSLSFLSSHSPKKHLRMLSLDPGSHTPPLLLDWRASARTHASPQGAGL